MVKKFIITIIYHIIAKELEDQGTNFKRSFNKVLRELDEEILKTSYNDLWNNYGSILEEKDKNEKFDQKLKKYTDYMKRLWANKERWASCYTKQSFSCGNFFI